MAIFRYSGRDKNGNMVSGELQSFSQDTALKHLQRLQIVPLSLETIDTKANVWGMLTAWRSQYTRVSVDTMVMFCKQMQALLRAGVPVNRALRGIAENQTAVNFRDILIDMSIGVDAGRDFCSTMEQHAQVFSPFMINILKMGEKTGRLDVAFAQLSQYLAQEHESGKRIKSAFRYPLIVLTAILAAMLIMNFFVIPQFAKVFESFDAQLPLMTRILIGMSNFLLAYWMIVLGGGAALLAWIRVYLRTHDGRFFWSRVQLSIPFLGKILYEAALARFARSFGVTAAAGLPILQAFDLLALAMDNPFLESKVLRMRRAIERGDTLFRTAQQSGLFTPLVLQMLAVGEETGEMEKLMMEIAEFYENQVDFDIKRLSQSIEPLLMAVMGVMVGVLAFGIFLPMWDLGKVIK